MHSFSGHRQLKHTQHFLVWKDWLQGHVTNSACMHMSVVSLFWPACYNSSLLWMQKITSQTGATVQTTPPIKRLSLFIVTQNRQSCSPSNILLHEFSCFSILFLWPHCSWFQASQMETCFLHAFCTNKKLIWSLASPQHWVLFKSLSVDMSQLKSSVPSAGSISDSGKLWLQTLQHFSTMLAFVLLINLLSSTDGWSVHSVITTRIRTEPCAAQKPMMDQITHTCHVTFLFSNSVRWHILYSSSTNRTEVAHILLRSKLFLCFYCHAALLFF